VCVFIFYLFLVVLIAVVTSLAGSGNPGFADGVGLQASFNGPYGIAVDASGTVFVADHMNRRIRKISPTGGTWGSAFSEEVLLWSFSVLRFRCLRGVEARCAPRFQSIVILKCHILFLSLVA
jgi:hypothetical protein